MAVATFVTSTRPRALPGRGEHVRCRARVCARRSPPGPWSRTHRNERLRTTANLSLKRHNLIRARGESLDLIAAERHHQKALAAEAHTADVEEANRRKLPTELGRLLD